MILTADVSSTGAIWFDGRYLCSSPATEDKDRCVIFYNHSCHTVESIDICKAHLHINEMSGAQLPERALMSCSWDPLHYHTSVPHNMSYYTTKCWRVKYHNISLNHPPLLFLCLGVQCVYWWWCGSLATHCDGWWMLKGVSADSFIMPGVISIHREQHTEAEELLSKILETSRVVTSNTVGSTFCTVCLGFLDPFFLSCVSPNLSPSLL